MIALHDTIHHKTDTLNSRLTQYGVPGGVVTVEFMPDASFDTAQFAPLILDAIDSSLLTDVNLTFRGGTSYYINGIQSISGLQNFFISAIKDNAGNNLKPNQANNETHFTILMPGVEFDFGDAPEAYGTLLADNGARHAISGTPAGPSATASRRRTNGLPSAKPTPIPTTASIGAYAILNAVRGHTDHGDGQRTRFPRRLDRLQPGRRLGRRRRTGVCQPAGVGRRQSVDDPDPADATSATRMPGSASARSAV